MLKEKKKIIAIGNNKLQQVRLDMMIVM